MEFYCECKLMLNGGKDIIAEIISLTFSDIWQRMWETTFIIENLITYLYVIRFAESMWGTEQVCL